MMWFLNFLLGRRLRSSEKKKQAIGVLVGLPALGLDGLSSSAYGPEAAMTILLPLGAASLTCIGPIMLVIVGLLTMLYFSYRQTIAAYPVNGGSYTVAKDNLGTGASLLAAAALMIDYVLTVAVGISAGVAALVSAAPQFHKYMLPLCLAVLAIVTLLNLRGTGEAGLTFAVPTYVFIVSMAVVLGLGIAKAIAGRGHPAPVFAPPPLPGGTETVGLWLLMRSFASGCTAMTGVEAVSNGVSAFREPTVKNAQRTLTGIVAILALLLLGIGYLARAYHVAAMDQSHPGYQSVVSQLVGAVVGRGLIYYLTLGSVLAVLCLSANTSFVDFPRLCHLLAKDDFLPRTFAAAGRRLVYSAGVLILALAAGLLLAAFGGITDRLIPLYAVGAFLAFTLSQVGMVMHWRKTMGNRSEHNLVGLEKYGKSRSYVKLWVNGVGAAGTAGALTIILAAKFTQGAWLTMIAIPLMIVLFRSVHRRYAQFEQQMKCLQPVDLTHNEPLVVFIPVTAWNRVTSKTLRFALRLSADVVAIHISNLEGDAAAGDASAFRQQWAQQVEQPACAAGVPPPKLVLPVSPYREFTGPILTEIDKVKSHSPRRQVVVVLPRVIEKHWWAALLHSRRASQLRTALRRREDFRAVVIEVPWFVEE